MYRPSLRNETNGSTLLPCYERYEGYKHSVHGRSQTVKNHYVMVVFEPPPFHPAVLEPRDRARQQASYKQLNYLNSS
uniref:Uncharacterized protein n=1 Tax=Picea sitchensis TaxID=3332 RepID=A0A6B9XRW9_PICSI|nr:hypothetical protein Q903MT_gene5443 [Picea sitchensis]